QPVSDLLIAAAGPAATLAMAGLCCFGELITTDSGLAGALLGYLMRANLALGLLNLLPIGPTDGGRMLRAGVLAITADTASVEAVLGLASRIGLAGLGGLGIL